MLIEKETKIEAGKIHGFLFKGTEVIGRVLSINDTEVVVQAPHHIVKQSPGPGQEPQMAFAPLIMMAADSVTMYRKDIDAAFLPDEGFLTAYESAMSEIIMPTSKKIIT